MRRYVIGLAIGITIGAGALTLRLAQPVSLDYSPFLYAAAASLVLAAAAGTWHLIQTRRGRR